MISARRRAGTRANKHRPVARQTHVSDRLIEDRYDNWAAWHETALAAPRPGLGRLCLSLAALSYDPAQGSKPSHPFRAVDIAACFPGRTVLAGERGPAAARRAGDCGRFAAPMTMAARQDAYKLQRGTAWLTARQDRRIRHKARSAGELV